MTEHKNDDARGASHSDAGLGADIDEDGYYDDDELAVGVTCCPHYVPYGSECDECDEDEADEAMGLTVPNEPSSPAAKQSGGARG